MRFRLASDALPSASRPADVNTALGASRRIGLAASSLRERYLRFAHGGLHLEQRDLLGELVQAGGTTAKPSSTVRVDLRSPSIYLWIVVDETSEIVGEVANTIVLRGSQLVAAQKQLRIRRGEWRRRGFGSALQAASEDWFRDFGVRASVIQAEGDGSVFAARRGFDFDLEAYRDRPGFSDLAGRERRFAAVDALIRHPGVRETVEVGEPPARESVLAFLMRLERLDDESARQVHEFRGCLPRLTGQGRERIATGGDRTFTSPGEIVAFGERAPLCALSGRGLGSAVMALTTWSGIKWLPESRASEM